MVDCYMSLNVPYAIELAQKCIDAKIDINWFEECLHPDGPSPSPSLPPHSSHYLLHLQE